MPSTSVCLPPLLCYPSPRILPPLFPSIHILVSCSAAVPSSSATIIYRPPQSPHRPLLPPLPSPLHCQFAPSASSCSAASFVAFSSSFRFGGGGLVFPLLPPDKVPAHAVNRYMEKKEREAGRVSVMLGAARKSNRCTKIRRRTECTPPDVSLHHEIIPSSLEAVGCGVGGDQRCSKRSAATTAIGLFSSP